MTFVYLHLLFADHGRCNHSFTAQSRKDHRRPDALCISPEQTLREKVTHGQEERRDPES